jgi:parvulin-like peptidyl-prolyl isomerase
MKMQMDNTIVSDSEAKEFYDKNAKKFMQQDSVHARHILVKEEKEAQEIIDTLALLKDKALQEKFIELAKAKSTGPSGPKGGDLGNFSKGQMVPEKRSQHLMNKSKKRSSYHLNKSNSLQR